MNLSILQLYPAVRRSMWRGCFFSTEGVRVTVNNNPVEIPVGSTLLDAIKKAGVSIPTFCYHPKFKPKSVCRMCLVEISGQDKLVPACSTPAKNGNQIATDSANLISFRRNETKMLLSRHPNECMKCEVSGNCKLQNFVQREQLDETWPKRPRGDPVHHPEHHLHDHTSPALYRDMDKCIECGLCVEACGSSGQDQHIIGFAERGFGAIPTTIFDTNLADTKCISCGQCTAVCPVGALTERPDWHRVLEILDARRKRTVVQVNLQHTAIQQYFTFVVFRLHLLLVSLLERLKQIDSYTLF